MEDTRILESQVLFIARIRCSETEKDIVSLAFLMPKLVFIKILSNFAFFYIFASGFFFFF